MFMGAGGSSLSTVSPASGDGVSGASATGGGGGVVEVGNPTARMNSTSQVTAHVSATSITADGSVSIDADANSRVTSYARNGGGGGVSIGDANATTNSTANTDAYVGSNVDISAGNDFILQTDSNHFVGSESRSTGGGAIASKRADTGATLNYTNKSEIRSGASITALDAVGIYANSAADGATTAFTESGGAGSGSVSNSTLNIGGSTQNEVDQAVDITADSVDINAQVDKLNGTSNSTARTYAFVAVADADSGVNLTSTVGNVIGVDGDDAAARTTITGSRGVDITAVAADLLSNRNRSVLPIGFIPVPRGGTQGGDNSTETIDVKRNVEVVAGVRDESRANGGGAAEISSGNSGLQKGSAITSYANKATPSLALYVDVRSGQDDSNELKWDADVTILSGGGEPELVIDQDGKIIKLTNVSVRDDRGDATELRAGDTISDGDYFVEVSNSGALGDAFFKAEQFVKNGIASPSNPSWPLFEFRNNFGNIDILDHSDQEMHIVKIDTINRGDELPLVQIESAPGAPRSSTTLEFDLRRAFAATEIDIQKIQRDRANLIRSDRDIVIDGDILNPIGFTRILNTDGNILASTPTAWIETSALDIEAINGSVGLNDANRVNVALVRGIDLGDVGNANDDAPRATTLYGAAQNDVYLNLKGIDRIPLDSSLQEPFIVSIDAIESRAGDVNLLLQDSEHQTGTGQLGGVRVFVPTETPVFDEILNNHFRPDVILPNAVDPAVLGGGTVTPIDSAYRFEPKQQLLARTLGVLSGTGLDVYDADMFGAIAPESAGLLADQDINIRHNSDATVIDLEGFTNLLPTNDQSDLLTATGLGVLDVVTSGSIDLTEVAGTLNVGQARSRKGNVILTVRDSATGNFENLRIDNNPNVDAEILAEVGEVVLRVGDDLLLTDTGKIRAARTVKIFGDFGNADADGSIIDLRGVITAQAPDTTQPAVDIVTDTDDDIVSLTNVQAGSPTRISTLQGNDLIQVGSLAATLPSLSNADGTLNRISDLLTVEGGNGSDRRQLDETGDTEENSGILSSTRLVGLGMASAEADQKRINRDKGIAYSGLEDLSLELGSNSDRMVITSTHSGATTVNTGDGDDTVDLGSNPVLDAEGRLQTDVDNKIISGGQLDDINGSLTLTGGNGINPAATPGTGPQNKDTMNIDERADVDGNTGANAGQIAATGDGRAQVTGLDMAGNVLYDQFEILNVDLSEFEDALTIEDNTDAGETTVKAGAGNDTVTVNLRSPIGEAIFVANGETGDDTIDAEGSTIGVVLNGNEGDDTVLGGSANDLIGGGSGGDTIDGNAGQDEIYGDSTYAEKATAATYDGYQFLGDAMTADPSTRPQPTEDASPGNDSIQGGAGEDTIYAEAGDDSVVGGSAEAGTADGTDYIYGGAGDDAIAGDNGTITNGTITLNDRVNGAEDIIFGDGGEIIRRENNSDTLLTARLAQSGGDDNIAGDVGDDILFGDNGRVVLSESAQPLKIETVNPTVGGSATVQGNADNDKILGGAAGDTLEGNQGEDIILGDHGRFDYLFEGATVSDVVDGAFAEVEVPADTDPTTLDVVTTTDPTEGGDDRIVAGTGDDLVFGGTGGDTIDGDDGQADGALAEGGADILLGDHGNYYTALPQEKRYRSIDTSEADGGGNDTIRGNQGDDKILGQQGDDQLFGESGEDDIIGGHNVLGGADGDDFIAGGADADVMLGDNGLITRRIQPDGSPERHPELFADVIRDVVRFDDAEAVRQVAETTSGDDTIQGGEGDDIAHGQRGDDLIAGDAGDDELYGELGNDTIDGGDDSDTILGDSGFIVRAVNADGTPRLNADGSWHRDVILTEVGAITREDSIETALPETARSEDIWLLANNNQMLSVDLLGPGNDVITGGDGQDAIFGQLGEDTISGGGDRDYIEGNLGNDILEGDAGDDIIIGDDGANLAAFDTNTPIVRRGFHLIDRAAGIDITLGDFGTVVLPTLAIQPKTLNSIAPVVGFTPSLGGNDNNIPPIGPLRQADGSELTVLASVIPTIGDHTGQQGDQPSLFSGNDRITDRQGDNTLIGDNYINITPLQTDDDLVNQQIAELINDIYQVSYGLHDLELGILHRDATETVNREIGNDVIIGGSDADWIVGDDQVFFGPFLTSEKDDETVALVDGLRSALGSFENSLYQQIDSLPKQSAQNYTPGQISIGNDELSGQEGGDRIIGDDHYLFAPVLTRIDAQLLWFRNGQRGREEGDRAQPLRGFDLLASNDIAQGNGGNDVVIGDYTTSILPVFDRLPSDDEDKAVLSSSINKVISDVEQYLRDLHRERYGLNFFDRDRSHQLEALNATLSGEDGDDLLVGDNLSVRLPIINGTPDFSLRLNSDRFNDEDDTYNFFHGLPSQSETLFRTPNALLAINGDSLSGDAGQDILLGSVGPDQLSGGSDADYLFGGKGTNQFDADFDEDVVRFRNPSTSDRDIINHTIDQLLASWLSPENKNYLDELISNADESDRGGDFQGQSPS